MRRVEMDFDKHRGGNKQGWWKTKMDFDKRGGWNKQGAWNIFMKSINVEGGIFQNRKAWAPRLLER